MPPPVVFVDYQVIDHLYRLDARTYAGAHETALRTFRAAATGGQYELWMAKITQVEMIRGRENPRLNPDRLPEIIGRDDAKLALARGFGVRWLSYPCSKLNDQYSRLNVSFRLAGDNWPVAEELEQRLERVAGVSIGDARQVVSLVHGFDDANPAYRPPIGWLVTEDKNLRVALHGEVIEGRLPELAGVRIASVAEFVGAG